MFGWLKDKVTGNSNSRGATELRALFAPLANLPRSPNRVAERLANFVLTGDDRDILTAVLAMKTTHTGGMTYALQAPDEPEQKGLRQADTLIPQDPQVFL